jgi:hypothetical protein
VAEITGKVNRYQTRKQVILAVVKIRVVDIVPERPRRESGYYVPWRLVSPQGSESCRWLCTDGRWIALTVGHDEDLGSVLITDSDGRRDAVDSYEDALSLARSLRT